MSSSIGKNFKISIFGESHAKGIGVVIDGVPSGYELDMDELYAFCQRRTSKGGLATNRQEKDKPIFYSGIVDNTTCGTPIGAVIENGDTHSGDYEKMKTIARPAHADFTGYVRYGGYNDIRGGGHFSGRLTAPLVLAGGIAKQILQAQGITVGVRIKSIGNVIDKDIDSITITEEQLEEIAQKEWPVANDEALEKMKAQIESAKQNLDSVGGVVECFVLGMPQGVGSPMFRGVENVVSSIVYGIPGVKAVEFGNGFECATLMGSQNNDEFIIKDGEVATKTNNHGGILGGITSGMPVVVRVAFKPTPSIAKEQNTVDFVERKEQKLEIVGRHDPCIALRGAVCVEAAVACAMLDLLMD